MTDLIPLFDIENADLIDTKEGEYNIYGKDYIIEFGLYELKEGDILPFAVLEEGFHEHKQMTCNTTYAKTKGLALNLIKERKEVFIKRSRL